MKEICHIMEGIDLDQEINYMLCGEFEPCSGGMFWMTMWTCETFEEDYDAVTCEECKEIFSLKMLGEAGERYST